MATTLLRARADLKPVVQHKDTGPDAQMTALHAAAKADQKDNLAALLCASADINGLHEYSDGTALWHAANEGNLQAIEFLLLHRADPEIESPESQGGSALCAAAAQGEYAAVAQLLRARANLNFRSSYTAPPLILACRHDEPDTAQLLLEAKAHTGEHALGGLPWQEIEFVTRKSWAQELLLEGQKEEKAGNSSKATRTQGRFAKPRRRLKQKASQRGSKKSLEPTTSKPLRQASGRLWAAGRLFSKEKTEARRRSSRLAGMETNIGHARKFLAADHEQPQYSRFSRAILLRKQP